MTILLVEKNKTILKQLEEMLGAILPDEKLLPYSDSPSALAKARKERVDVAVLDANLPEIDGLLLGRYLKDIYPSINLILMTKNRADAFEAMALRASGCVLMPPAKEDMAQEIKELRNPAGKEHGKRVFAQTFGNFELFVEGIPVAFKYSKTKEIVALLINNKGVQTTNGEIIASLWEDDGDPKVKSSYLSNLRQDLQNTLADLKLNDIIIKQRGSMAIVMDKIECDLFEWLSKKNESRYPYLGDYMNQYSWAELVHAELDEISYMLEEEE
ncbi:MAG: response regulator [Eubacterium sp.]|nr:response regulator [Eubacterium sp.]